jgi:hypothetical protein
VTHRLHRYAGPSSLAMYEDEWDDDGAAVWFHLYECVTCGFPLSIQVRGDR